MNETKRNEAKMENIESVERDMRVCACISVFIWLAELIERWKWTMLCRLSHKHTHVIYCIGALAYGHEQATAP